MIEWSTVLGAGPGQKSSERSDACLSDGFVIVRPWPSFLSSAPLPYPYLFSPMIDRA